MKGAKNILIAGGIIYVLLLFFLLQTIRADFPQLIAFFTLLFGLYGGLLYYLKGKTQSGLDHPWILPVAAVLHLIAVFSLPELSDDYFRFVWDGRLLNNGLNPFLYLPTELMQAPSNAGIYGLTPQLYEQLNSPDYYTVYPPICQLVFWLGAWLSPESLAGHVYIMKGCVFLAQLATLLIIRRLLHKLKLPAALLAIYAFNPLVIVELTGNLHFEGIMIAFLMFSILLLLEGHWVGAAISFGLAVSTKLLPLMLLPLLIRRLGWLRSILFGGIVGIVTLLCFLPILSSEALLNQSQSLDLYFQSFEFNASLYYLLRQLGLWITGFNLISLFGRLLMLLTLGAILFYSWREEEPRLANLPSAMMWVYFIYFACATTVNPWYIAPLISFAVFSRFRFLLVWTALLPLTYFTYRTSACIESPWILWLEYGLLFGFVWAELKGRFRLPII